MSDTDQDRGLFADLCAKLDLSIGSTDRLTKQLSKPRKRLPPQQPSIIRARGSAVANSSGLAVIQFDLNGPDQGHLWYIRGMRIGGVTPITTAAGRADVYVSGGYTPVALAGSLVGLGLSDWQDFAASLPDVSFYGIGEMPVQTNEHVFIVISSGTNAQEYVANITVFDYELAPEKQDWSM